MKFLSELHNLSPCYDVVSTNFAPNYQVSRTTLSHQKWKPFSLTWPDFKTWMKFDQSDLFILWISTMIWLAGPLIWAISGVGSDEKHDNTDSKIIDRYRHLFLTSRTTCWAAHKSRFCNYWNCWNMWNTANCRDWAIQKRSPHSKIISY